MTTKAKRTVSAQVNKILKENGFYRLGGGWKEGILHIGVQPVGKFDPNFSHEVANERYKACIKQIKALPDVQKTKAREWHFGWNSMAGIEIIF